MNVNNSNITGAAGFPPAPEAPENAPTGNSFGRSVIVVDAKSFNYSASIYDARGEIKATIHTPDQITSAELSADGTRAMINTRDGVSRAYSLSHKTEGLWILEDSITPADLSADGTQAVITTSDGVAKTYAKDAQGLWSLQEDTSMEK
ncbi:hypothetical protein [Endozoicomonas sp. 8E]|uniref:hypothetical protein n=1 Tax=Endozoicomonas sp. 8E TaxID=3035692 RepID=UPI00293914CE|nr:hypothetical protein [Endozoicomonas sp. 8E]WOG26618.1 hypothetical protein P6910_19010 [Endozoicomonas sp. 8E]